VLVIRQMLHLPFKVDKLLHPHLLTPFKVIIVN